MVEKKNDEKQPEKKTASKPTAGTKKSTAKKAAAREGRESAKAAEKPPVEEEAKAAPEEGQQLEAEAQAAPEEEKELSEEEFHRIVEESLEKVKVCDIVLAMMNELASIGYMKMGLPESVNLKYRDFDQSSLAIDALEGLIKGAEGKVPEESLQPFRGTLANLQLNFVQLKRV